VLLTYCKSLTLLEFFATACLVVYFGSKQIVGRLKDRNSSFIVRACFISHTGSSVVRCWNNFLYREMSLLLIDVDHFENRTVHVVHYYYSTTYKSVWWPVDAVTTSERRKMPRWKRMARTANFPAHTLWLGYEKCEKMRTDLRRHSNTITCCCAVFWAIFSLHWNMRWNNGAVGHFPYSSCRAYSMGGNCFRQVRWRKPPFSPTYNGQQTVLEKQKRLTGKLTNMYC